jgi:S1-C subfamily serine protease
MVPAQCWVRVVGLALPGSLGSGFTLTLHGRQWLVTARHVVDGWDVEDIRVTTLRGAGTNRLERIADMQPGADIAVFSVDGELTQDLPLAATLEGICYSQDAYFLGFPFGFGLNPQDSSLPFVKKAIISALYKDVNGVGLVLLDGINNPGFSGGPVVFCRQGTQDWHVAGVVSSYWTEQVSVVGGVGTVEANTGIIVAYDIRHAVEAIDSSTGG